jgi:hypothetical protein
MKSSETAATMWPLAPGFGSIVVRIRFGVGSHVGPTRVQIIEPAAVSTKPTQTKFWSISLRVRNGTERAKLCPLCRGLSKVRQQ